MISTKMLNAEIHNYLSNCKGIEEYFAATEALIGVALINREIKGEDLMMFQELMEYYNNPIIEKEFKSVIDSCVNYLYKKYKDEDIQYKNGEIISAEYMFTRAQKRGLSFKSSQFKPNNYVICSKCSAVLPINANFCPNCGSKVK